MIYYSCYRTKLNDLFYTFNFFNSWLSQNLKKFILKKKFIQYYLFLILFSEIYLIIIYQFCDYKTNF